MKSFKSISVLTLLFSVSLFIISCGGGAGEADHSHDATSEQADHDHADHSHEATTTTAHGEGKEYTSAYVCPMHCEGSGSEESGNCPKCGMAYVAQAEHVKDGHSH